MVASFQSGEINGIKQSIPTVQIPPIVLTTSTTINYLIDVRGVLQVEGRFGEEFI